MSRSLHSDSGADPVVVLVTFADIAEARSISNALVEERLAACVNLHPGVESIYRWDENIEKAAEVAGVVKTTRARLTETETRYRELHSYDVPEFLVLGVASGGAAYLDWLARSVSPLA